MDTLVVDSRDELGVLVQPRLVLPPVVAADPVVDEVTDVVERNAIDPAGAVQLIGPAGTREAVLEIVELGLGISTRNGSS
jgi:hypothetical protein